MNNFAATGLCMLASMLMASGAFAGYISSRETDGIWGKWGRSMFCESGKFVFGYRLRSEPMQGKGDDTALNAIELRCARFGHIGPYTTIFSKSAPWGKFSEYKYCPGDNPVIGFNMKIEPRQGRGDDTAANKVGLYCTKDEYLLASTATSWGEWTQPVLCPIGWAVTGFGTRVEDNQGSGDDTALNGIRMYCGRYRQQTMRR